MSIGGNKKCDCNKRGNGIESKNVEQTVVAKHRSVYLVVSNIQSNAGTLALRCPSLRHIMYQNTVHKWRRGQKYLLMDLYI